MKKFLALLLMSCLCFGATDAAFARSPKRQQAAQPTKADGIAAVVNDGIVTSGEVEDRVVLILSSSGMKRDEASKAKLRGSVLETLITEQVQLQEAKANGALPSTPQIEAGIAQIAAGNNMKPEQFLTLIARDGVNPASLQRQIAAQLAWQNLVQKTVRPQINVSDSEIEAEKERLKQFAGQTEYLLAEIFLPFDATGGDLKTQKMADDLIAEIKKGARFSELARQFSKSPTAQNGGQLGWLRDNQLEPAQALSIRVLTKENPLSNAVRTDNGYHIYFLREARTITAPDAANSTQDTVFDLRDLSVPITTTLEDAQKRADQLRRETGTCEAIAKRVSLETDLQLEPLKLKLSTLSDTLKETFATAEAGQVLPMAETDKAARLRFVCSKTAVTSSDIDEQIANQIGGARLETMAKRYMRDLMATAFIERR